jgi:hypothetical protein
MDQGNWSRARRCMAVLAAASLGAIRKPNESLVRHCAYTQALTVITQTLDCSPGPGLSLALPSSLLFSTG